MPRTRLPVVILAGPLGAGKTTLLNRLLRKSGARLGVIMNDFGAVDVDGLLVRGQVDSRSIAGGCLCCIADTSGLDGAFEALSRPALGLDAIILEGSGLAEPRQLARLVMSTPVHGVRFGGLVEIVDLGAVERAIAAAPAPELAELPVSPDALAVASLIVANKADAATDPGAAVEALVAAGARAPITRATRARIDPALILDPALDAGRDADESPGAREDADDELPIEALLRELEAEEAARAEGADAEGPDRDSPGHPHRHAVSASIVDPRPAHPRRLLELLESLPRGVVRAKGIVWLDAPGMRGDELVVQAVGGWLALERRRRAPGAPRETRLVLIAVDAEHEHDHGHEHGPEHGDAREAELRAALEAVLDDEGGRTEPELWGVLRYAGEGDDAPWDPDELDAVDDPASLGSDDGDAEGRDRV